MTSFYKKKSKPRLWCFGVSNCFVTGENVRRQGLSKSFNATHSKKKVEFKIYETMKVNLI